MSLKIDITYDSSVTALDTPGNPAYDPTLYADYTSAVQAAVNFYESTFTNNVTLKISFGWGEVGGSPIEGGDIGESSSFIEDFTYSQVRAAAIATDTTSTVQTTAVSTLLPTDPTGGAKFGITEAEAAVLGLDKTYSGSDGSVGLDGPQSYSWNQSNITSGTYDAVGVLEHEISEVLGRLDDGGANNTYTLLDMFRYTAADGQSGDAPGSAAGVRDDPFVAGYSANAYSYFSYDGKHVTLQYDVPSDVAGGADIGDWAQSVRGNWSGGYADQGVQNLVSTTDLEEMNVLGYDLACYLPGTRIATPTGEIPVENLAVGDMVLTHRGAVRPIVWIGYGKALATRGQRSAANPVIVRKDALAENVPDRDLHITKGHALYLDGVLIPAEFLVNHRSIVWDDRAQEVTVYHIELETHDVLLANGAPAESFRDDGNRWLFHNNEWDCALREAACAPVLTGGAVVDAVWSRLLARCPPGPDLRLTDDPDLHLLVDGRRVDGGRRPNGLYSFRVPQRPTDVRIVSRAGAQDELGLKRDPRLLGVAVQRIVLWRGARPTVIDADDECLVQGFHAYEADNLFRWTDGAAILPESLFAGDGLFSSIDLHIASTTWYPLMQEAVAA